MGFIVDIKCTFNGDNTMDFDNNVKIQHQEIKCPKVPITVNGNTITFPNIQKTGDCMGDALRGQKKDVTKFSIGINSDGTLTFHSTWPDLKLKKASELEAPAAAELPLGLGKFTVHGLKCPQAKGPISISQTTKLPSFDPLSEFSVKMDTQDQNAAAVLCIDVTVKKKSLAAPPAEEIMIV